MKRKFLALFTSVVAIFVLISSAFAIWMFEDLSHKIEIVNETIKVDDIYENYAFGKEDPNKTYELYIYPSTMYYEIYNKNDQSVKPLEDTFGYVNVKVDFDGNLIYDDLGNVQYEVVKKNGWNSSANTGDLAYKEYVQQYDDSSNYYFNMSGSKAVYDRSKTRVGESRTYGVPGETCNEGADWGENDVGAHEDPTYNNKMPFIHDRFGCWDDFYFDTDGRYLPLRIEVTNSLNIQTFSKAVGKLYCAMGDNANWFDRKFASWYPLSSNNNQFTDPLTPIKGGDVSRFFDMTSTIQKYVSRTYTDATTGITKNVISILPVFSDGKGYGATSYESGGRDALKIKVARNGQSVPDKTFGVYISDSLKTTNTINGYDPSYIKYSTIPPFRVDSNTTGILVEGAPVNTRADWAGDWNTSCHLSPSAIEKLISIAGEGLYRLYIFVGNSGSDQTGSGGSPNRLGTDFINSIVPNENSGYSLLENKNLIIYDAGQGMPFEGISIVNTTYTNMNSNSNVNTNYIYGNGKKSKGCEFVFEKINTTAILTGFTESNTSQGYQAELEEKKGSSKTLYREEKGTIFDKSALDLNGTVGSLQARNEHNDYVYLVKNVDFRNLGEDKQNFKFLLSNTMIQTQFNMSESLPKVVLNPQNVNNSYSYQESDVYEPLGRYFQLSDLRITDGNDEKLFTLKDSFTEGNITKALSPGVYDILAIRDLSDMTIKKYDMYCHRHMNIFVKLFEDDLSDRNKDQTINHTNTGTNICYWHKQYAIGELITEADISLEHNNIDFKNALISIYEKKLEENASLTGLKVFDHCSMEKIATLTKNGDSYGLVFSRPFTIEKNYIFYTQGF